MSIVMQTALVTQSAEGAAETGLSLATGKGPADPTLLDFLDGEWEVLLEVVELFLEECPRWMENMSRAITAKDAALLYQNAHTLRTCVVILAFPASSGLLLRLETVRGSWSLGGIGHTVPHSRSTIQAEPVLTVFSLVGSRENRQIDNPKGWRHRCIVGAPARVFTETHIWLDTVCTPLFCAA
jgi:hypothetical protein